MFGLQDKLLSSWRAEQGHQRAGDPPGLAGNDQDGRERAR